MRQIVEKAKAGDLDAFGQLVERYQDAVFGAAYALLGDFHDAQDAAQEAFIRSWCRLGDLREPERFPGWLYRITRNCCLGFRRRSGRRAVSLERDDAAAQESEGPGPAGRLEAREMRDAVLAAIRSLSEPNRLATTLFYINGYRVAEVAEFLDVPAGTVKRRLHDSRKQLKERMIHMVAEELKARKTAADLKALVDKAVALQGQQKFADALRVHEDALGSKEYEDTSADLWSDCYYLLAPSYRDAGRMLELAEGIVDGLVALAPPEQERWLIKRYWEASGAFLAASKPARAAECARHMLAVADTISGCPDCRYWRNEALWTLWRVASMQDRRWALRRADARDQR